MGALQAARYEDLKQGLQDIKGLIQSELKTVIAQVSHIIWKSLP